MKTRAGRLLVPVFFLLWATHAHAAFSVSPLRFDLQAQKGQAGTFSIRVSNNDEKPVSVKVYQKDFKTDSKGQDIILPPGNVERGCAEWFQISPTNLELGPKETRNVRVSLKVPEDAAGSYAGFILVEQTSKPQPIRKLKNGYSFQLAVKPRWIIRVHEHVPGTAEKSGQITDLSVIHPQNENTPLKMAVEFENTGNALLRCDGYVEIRDEGGQEIETVQVGRHGKFGIYPDSKRLVTGNVSTKLPPGNYVALAIVDYDGEDLVAGELEFEVKPETAKMVEKR